VRRNKISAITTSGSIMTLSYGYRVEPYPLGPNEIIGTRPRLRSPVKRSREKPPPVVQGPHLYHFSWRFKKKSELVFVLSLPTFPFPSGLPILSQARKRKRCSALGLPSSPLSAPLLPLPLQPRISFSTPVTTFGGVSTIRRSDFFYPQVFRLQVTNSDNNIGFDCNGTHPATQYTVL